MTAKQHIAHATAMVKLEFEDPDKVEDILPMWSGERVILDVKYDGAWSRYAYTPVDELDSFILAEAKAE